MNMPGLNNTLSLMKVRMLCLKNHFGRPNADKVTRWSLILGLGSLFLWADYVFFYRVIQYLDGLPLQIGEELIVQLLNVVFLTLFAMVLFSSIIASLSIYYISSDLECLHSLPLSLGSIVTIRLGQTVVNASWMVLTTSSSSGLSSGLLLANSNRFTAASPTGG